MSCEPNFASIWVALLVLAGGLIMLVGGGEFLISGSTKLARRLGMSPVLIGLTVVAFGTSIPELFVSLSATLQGHTDIMIGNVIGSNIANIGLILGFSAVLVPLHMELKKISTELSLLLIVGIFVAGICYTGFFHRLWGALFVAGLVLYTYIAYRRAKNKRKINSAAKRSSAQQHSYFKIAGFVVTGLLLLPIGSDLFIDGAVDVARVLGISDLVIGLTLAAVGTSLPELASSISAIRHRESDMLVGNVVGSNLFNLMMVMGGTAAITPFPVSKDVLVRDLPVMIAFSAVLIPILFFGQVIKRRHGVLLLSAYAAYLALLA